MIMATIDLEATMVRAPAPKAELRHWKLSREPDGLAVLVFDKADATANTLSADAMAEFNRVLDQLDREKPRALLIRSGKASGFIAGADVDEFTTLSTEEGATALVKRGWDTFERLAAVPYPTLALIRGFCLGGGLELALACRYRVAIDLPSGLSAWAAIFNEEVAGVGVHVRDAPGKAIRATHRHDRAPGQRRSHRILAATPA